MSILIKGMDMPEQCIDCELCTLKVMGTLRTTCIICRHNGEEIALYGRRDDCPLIKLPPHGRLIDADAWIVKVREELLSPRSKKGVLETMGAMFRDVLDAPTIIESEGDNG